MSATVVLGVLATCALLGLLGVGVHFLIADGDPRDSVQVAATPTTATSTTTAASTTAVIERYTLPAGQREVATVRSGLGRITVRSQPPAGWDQRLTPVVVPDTVAIPRPPRSAADLGRVPLPATDAPIAGRGVTAEGWAFANPTLYRPPQPLVFSVLARQGSWIQVLVPVRPNGTTGWLQSNDVELAITTLRVEVSIADRKLQLIDGTQVALSVPVSVGRASTPTPTGSFFVTDIVPSVDPAGAYGPVALALNGYSEVMDSFGSESVAGSPDELAPVLAVHGTNQPSSIARAASNGCPRLFNDDMSRLAAMVPAGTPVDIWP